MAKNSAGSGIKVAGLRDLRRGLSIFDDKTKKELRHAGKSLATDVSGDARDRAYSLGGVAAKAAPSIKPTTASYGLLSAGVMFGGDAYPFAGGAEFGSLRYKQFKPWRGNGSDAGYFVYPSIRANSSMIEERMTAAIDVALRKAGMA